MLKQLTQDYKDKYNKQDLKDIEEIETLFIFDSFDSATALDLGNQIIKASLPYEDEIALMIIRESDQLPIFQYVDNTKAQRNIDFALKKRNASLKNGHCSLWSLIKNVVDHDVVLDEDCLPVGGAFPIHVNNEHTYTICISGLHDGKDFQLIVDTLSKYQNKVVPTLEVLI